MIFAKVEQLIAESLNYEKNIEDFDLLIGCAAKAAGLTVVTHNVKHFSHIEDLDIEDWVK